MFSLSTDPIDPAALAAAMRDDAAGALATFTGVVRDRNHGRVVTGLVYEVYPELCAREGAAILDEAKARFGIIAADCVHRSGELKVGAPAVWVGVLAAHRAGAFAACRFIIDEIKRRLPIWKKEFTLDGKADWVSCAHDDAAAVPRPAFSEQDYLARQLNLPQVGAEGQARLRAARVLVVGAGGLGCPALTALAQSGVGHITLVEPDRVEASNLHRQTLYTAADVGRPKAAAAAARLRAMNPFIEIQAFGERVTPENVEAHLREQALVLDCTDDAPTKYLLNDACYLGGKILVQAGVHRFEGQLRVMNPGDFHGCLRCLWPQVPPPGCAGDCNADGVLGAVPNLVGFWQALEAVGLILGMPDRLGARLLVCDLSSHHVRALRMSRDPFCPLCGEDPRIHEISDGNDAVVAAGMLDIPAEELTADPSDRSVWIDVRESVERDALPVTIKESVHLPMSEMDAWDFPFDPQTPYVVFCAKGLRSRHVAAALRERGINHARSVAGGVPAINARFA